MRRHNKNKHKQEGQINVVPYIDVMLVLLVIFMVTAPLISQSVIELPTAGDVGTTQQHEAIEIQLPLDGTFTVKDYNFGGEETNFHGIEDALNLITERRATFAQAPVLIAAHKDLPYAQVVAVLSQLHDAGITNIGLMTRTEE